MLDNNLSVEFIESWGHFFGKYLQNRYSKIPTNKRGLKKICETYLKTTALTIIKSLSVSVASLSYNTETVLVTFAGNATIVIM